MIGRILWLVALLGIAAITAALQLDRQSETEPQLIPFVPGSSRNYAQAQLTASTLERGDPATVLADARELVLRRPMPAEHLTLLAAAQARAGDADAAEFTIQLAAQRGWREPVAQETMLRLALAAGDKAEAARRYAALFRAQGTPDALLVELGPQVLDEPDGVGRKTFADIIVAAPRWHEQFLQRGVQVLTPFEFSVVTSISLQEGAAFDCPQLGQSIEALARRDAGAARRLSIAASGLCRDLAPPGLFPL